MDKIVSERRKQASSLTRGLRQISRDGAQLFDQVEGLIT
jgi:hypothetical protein